MSVKLSQSSSYSKKGGVLASALLIAASCSGGGLTALPIYTGIGGFYPGVAMTAFIWLVTLATGLLLFEAILGMPDGCNMVTLGKHYLGKWAGTIFGLFFVILYYSFMLDFLVGSVEFFRDILEKDWQILFPKWVAYLSLTFLLGLLGFMGTRVSSRVNFVLFTALILTIVSMALIGASNVTEKNLSRWNWTFMLLSGPLLFAVFSFHNILPTISTYLKRDIKKVRLSIWIGTLIALFVYILWQWLNIGTFSEGVLWEAFEKGEQNVSDFHLKMPSPLLEKMTLFFSFFDVTTSVIVMGLTLIDFLGDGMGIHVQNRIGMRRLSLCLLAFLPPAIVGLFFSEVSTFALNAIEGFGQILLFAVFPVLLAWFAREDKAGAPPKQLPGGRMMIFLIFIISFYILYLQGIVLTP